MSSRGTGEHRVTAVPFKKDTTQNVKCINPIIKILLKDNTVIDYILCIFYVYSVKGKLSQIFMCLFKGLLINWNYIICTQDHIFSYHNRCFFKLSKYLPIGQIIQSFIKHLQKVQVLKKFAWCKNEQIIMQHFKWDSSLNGVAQLFFSVFDVVIPNLALFPCRMCLFSRCKCCLVLFLLFLEWCFCALHADRCSRRLINIWGSTVCCSHSTWEHNMIRG